MTRRLQGSAARLCVIAAFVAFAVAACGAQPAGDVHPGPGGPDAVGLVTRDNTFEPGRLQLPAGEEVEIEITNEGGTTHDFTIESLDLSTGPIKEGGLATATLTVPEGETSF